MKVLLFTNLFPSAQEPTRGVFNLNRFRALANHCEVRLVSPLPWWSRIRRPAEWFVAPQEDATGIRAAYPTYWSVPGRSQLHGRAMHASLHAYLHRLWREFPFDAILAAFAYPDGVAAARFAREADCPLVTMVLGSDINEYTQNPGLREQIVEGLTQSRRVVAVSQALKDGVVGLGIPEQKVVLQRNGVDGDRFSLRSKPEASRRLSLPESGRRVTFVGNLKPEKGVETLIEAMGLLHQSGETDATLSLVGGGPLEETLKAKVHALGIEDKVQFHGRRPHEEIPYWIGAGDLLCLPSFREGCPNVVLEALASGRPVVASHVGGVPELVGEGCGYTVPPGDAPALAQALLRALEEEWNPASLRSSVQFLSWDQFGTTLRDTLVEAITEHRGVLRQRFTARAA